MSEDMYIKSNLTADDIKNIVNQVVDIIDYTGNIERPEKKENKPKTKVKKLVTIVSER